MLDDSAWFEVSPFYKNKTSINRTRIKVTVQRHPKDSGDELTDEIKSLKPARVKPTSARRRFHAEVSSIISQTSKRKTLFPDLNVALRDIVHDSCYGGQFRTLLLRTKTNRERFTSDQVPSLRVLTHGTCQNYRLGRCRQ